MRPPHFPPPGAPARPSRLAQGWRLRPPGIASGAAAFATMLLADALFWPAVLAVAGLALCFAAWLFWAYGLFSPRLRPYPDRRFVGATIVPILAVSACVLFLTGLPTKAAFFVSRPFLEHVAATPRDDATLAGLFPISSVTRHDGITYLDTPPTFFNTCGLLHEAPSASAEDIMTTSPPTTLTHLTGPWYTYCQGLLT